MEEAPAAEPAAPASAPPDVATALGSIQMQLELLTKAVTKIQSQASRTESQLSLLTEERELERGGGRRSSVGAGPMSASYGRQISVLQEPSSVTLRPGMGRRGSMFTSCSALQLPVRRNSNLEPNLVDEEETDDDSGSSVRPSATDSSAGDGGDG